MKAITLKQPWASLVRDELKGVETRSWRTSHKGDLAIHAGLTVDEEKCIEFHYDPETIERGVILCVVNLVACVQFPNPRVSPDAYGDYTAGRYGWIFENVRRVEPPIKAKGMQGLWNFYGLDATRQTQLFT